jgi:hypothetical protein
MCLGGVSTRMFKAALRYLDMAAAPASSGRMD